MLRRSDDWVLLVDLDSKLSLPPKIVITKLRPDIVMYSNKEKMVILIELTVPWEDRFEESHQLKSAKYAGLVSDITSNGWRSQCFPVEVGTRGFPATSLRRMFLDLGFSSRKTYQGCKAAGSAAEGATQWLWHKRSDIWQTFIIAIIVRKVTVQHNSDISPTGAEFGPWQTTLKVDRTPVVVDALCCAITLMKVVPH